MITCKSGDLVAAPHFSSSSWRQDWFPLTMTGETRQDAGPFSVGLGDSRKRLLVTHRAAR